MTAHRLAPWRRPTKSDRLLAVLADHKWHSTRELARRVGHRFGCVKWHLVRGLDEPHDIEVRSHPTKFPERQYRLRDGPRR